VVHLSGVALFIYKTKTIELVSIVMISGMAILIDD